MDINLELYRVFYYVANTLSFSEASRQLFISQSAVSQSVKSLEKKLGHPLFIRSTKKVALTPEGELLLAHVRPAIQMLDEGEALLSGGNTLKGQLRIGASDTICRYFLIHYFHRFHQDYPDVRIKITNSTSIGCIDLLENRQVDLIVCNYPNSRLHPHTQMKIVREFQDVFVANPDFFPLGDHPVELKQLLEYPILMLSPKSTTSEYLHHIFTAHGLNLVPEIELNSNDLLIDLARIGLGIACVPDYMLDSEETRRKEKSFIQPDESPGKSFPSSRLVRVPLQTPLPGRQMVLVSPPALPLSQAAQRFMEYFI